MPQSLIPYLDPTGRQPISDVHPVNCVTLQDARNVWNKKLIVEEMHFPGPAELTEYSLLGDTLCLILDPIPQIERMADGRWYSGAVPAGTVMIFPTEMPISGRWLEGGFRIISVNLNPVHVARMVPEAVGMELAFQFTGTDLQIERIALTLRDELAAGCPSGQLFGEHLASALAVHLLTRYAVHPVKLKDYQRGLGKSDLSRVLAYIHDQLADDLSLDDLAACCHLSPYHFARLFKQSTGQSPYQYVLAQRVEKAKSLLLRGGLSVGDVSQIVGFSDQSQFQRHFKRLTGLTPGQFAKR